MRWTPEVLWQSMIDYIVASPFKILKLRAIQTGWRRVPYHQVIHNWRQKYNSSPSRTVLSWYQQYCEEQAFNLMMRWRLYKERALTKVLCQILVTLWWNKSVSNRRPCLIQRYQAKSIASCCHEIKLKLTNIQNISYEFKLKGVATDLIVWNRGGCSMEAPHGVFWEHFYLDWTLLPVCKYAY